MHRTVTREDVLQALAVSELSESRAAAQLLQEGELGVGSHVGSSRELLETYQLRLDHLRSQSGAHAHRLAQATSELVENLKSRGGQSGHWLTIRGEQELHFIVWRLEQGQLLGCLPVVSKLDVSL